MADTNNDSVWRKIMDKAAEFGGNISTAISGLSDTVKSWARNLADRIMHRDDNADASLSTENSVQEVEQSDHMPLDMQADNSISTVNADQPSDTDNQAVKYVLFKDLDFSIDDSTEESYYLSQFTNMVLLNIAKENSFAVNGESACDFDKVNTEYNEFSEYYEKYIELQSQYESDPQALDSALDKLDSSQNGGKYRAMIENIIQTQSDYMDKIDLYVERNIDDFSNIYAEFPDAALAAGDIDYDEYLGFTDDKKAFGADLIQRDDKNRTTIVFDIDKNETDSDVTLAARITNLATLRYAEGLSKEGAVDETALKEKVEAFRKYAESVSSASQNGTLEELDSKTDSDIKSMYVRCSSDISDFENAKCEKDKYCEQVKDSSSQAAIMKYFYEGYSDPDVSYAYGAIDQDIYESKLTSNLIEMPTEDFNAYVASVRGSQVVDPTDETDAEKDEQAET